VPLRYVFNILSFKGFSHMPVPTFLIIGAMKAGTTSLYHAFGQHPRVFMTPTKEPHFFSYEGRPTSRDHIVTDWDAYRALFTGSESFSARGEASPSYLPAPHAAPTILKYVPDCKLIAVLRDPVERAYSQYLHNFKSGYEQHDDFLTAFDANQIEYDTRGEGWRSYQNQGMYGAHLTRYFALFPRDQIKVVFYDDYVRDAAGVMRDLFAFIGVDDDVQTHNDWYYKSGKPKSRLIHALVSGRIPAIRQLARALIPKQARSRVKSALHNANVTQSKITADQRAVLLPVYHDDTLRLSEMLGRDLSTWRV